jgi:hypothetical protein
MIDLVSVHMSGIVVQTSDIRIAVRLWIRGLRNPSSFQVRNGKTTRPVSSHAVGMWSSSEEGRIVVLSMLTRCCSQAKDQNVSEDIVLEPHVHALPRR